MEHKYRALRFIASVLKVLGIIVGILAVIAAITFCATSVFGGAAFERALGSYGQNTPGLGLFTGLLGGIIFSIVPIIVGGIQALVLFAVGEAIYVQIDIEQNTRLTEQAILRMMGAYEPPARPAAAPPAAPSAVQPAAPVPPAQP